MKFIKKILNLLGDDEPVLEQVDPNELIAELKDLLRITHNNVRYIRSYSNVLKGMSVTMKGSSAAETRRKRNWAKSKLEWLAYKLKEEQVMVELYTERLKQYS